jgi:hypothetical protein
MLRNVGPEDRIIRIVVGIGIAVVIYFAGLHGIGAIIAGIVAAVLVITGLLARCPFYKMVDVDTSVQEQPYSTTDDRAGF